MMAEPSNNISKIHNRRFCGETLLLKPMQATHQVLALLLGGAWWLVQAPSD